MKPRQEIDRGAICETVATIVDILNHNVPIKQVPDVLKGVEFFFAPPHSYSVELVREAGKE